jgi:predicted DNA binding CopG/RHH family protein
MKKTFNIYFSEEKLAEIKEKAKALDIPVSTYIKSKIFKEDTRKE